LGEVLPVTSIDPDGRRLCIQFNKYTIEINPWSCCLEAPAAGADEGNPEEQLGKKDNFHLLNFYTTRDFFKIKSG